MQLRKLIRKMSGLPASVHPVSAEIKNATPVEEAWDPAQCQMIGAEYPFLSSVKNQQVDGLWLCHCGTENLLTHITGKYPFGYLQCRRCSHVLCDDCRTSEILTQIPIEATELFRPRFHEGNQMAYCSVCQHCGLSHRATMSGGCLDFSVLSCTDCQHPLQPGSTGYYIGSIVDFRRDPEGTAVAMKLDWNLGKSVSPEPSTDTAKPPSPLSRPSPPVRATKPVWVQTAAPTTPATPDRAHVRRRTEPIRPSAPPCTRKSVAAEPSTEAAMLPSPPVLVTQPPRVNVIAPSPPVSLAKAQVWRETEPVRPSAPPRAITLSRLSRGVDLSGEDLERRQKARQISIQNRSQPGFPPAHRPKLQARSQTVAGPAERVIIQPPPSTGFKDLDEVMAQLRSIPGYRAVA
ncbi:hypothetical protein HBI81_076940 [Parastagonospora nodorum]|nr:hypothetical protein HBH92_059240 [Parastagonospora nodorum]KAH4432573.1 hypothetical protein HBH93_136410 [Parastagonospora nodorum]KAH4458117.1 hypothetical protein HBH91_088450 [Parastagonospora nodorum]KAH4511447.1 hypothetical protein HBH89_047680 [Parastagonospora nodorum]KAH4548969.1 hypothetical protein HBH85_052570 [Parastagonospora nodorum]